MAERDKLISINEVAKRLPGKVAISTIHRWAMKGVNGVKLKSVRVGHRRYVTQEGIDEFIKELSKTDSERLAEEGA